MAAPRSRRATARAGAARRTSAGKPRRASASRPRRTQTSKRASAPQPRRAETAKRASAPRAATTAQPAARAATPPNGIGLTGHVTDFTTHDLEGMRRFYAEVLGFSDARIWEEFGYLMVNVTAGSSLGFGAPMPGPPESWRPPTEPALYLFVADVDATYAALRRKGVAFERAPENVPWGHRVAMFKDPEGRTICIATRLGNP